MINIMEQSGNPAYGLTQFILDTEDDVASLTPRVAPGSTALVASTGNIYILNNQREWVQL